MRYVVIKLCIQQKVNEKVDFGVIYFSNKIPIIIFFFSYFVL